MMNYQSYVPVCSSGSANAYHGKTRGRYDINILIVYTHTYLLLSCTYHTDIFQLGLYPILHVDIDTLTPSYAQKCEALW